MSELSDLALLGIGALVLFVIYVLRMIWGRESVKVERRLPDKTKTSDTGTPVVVDGSNVMHWGGEPSIMVICRVLVSLRGKGFAPYVIFDANVGYKLGDRYLDDAHMAQMIGLPKDRVLVVEKGVSADERILAVASEQNVRIVSNDQFRDWTTQYPIIRKKGSVMRGTYKGGNVVWKSI